MTTDAQHPDQLEPGHAVGPWHIVAVTGRGGSSRVFKVERDGYPFSMKMALLPLTLSEEELTQEQHVEEKSAWRRLAHEAAALFTYATHPNLLRAYAVDFWPGPTKGYAFIVTDFIEGDTWHQWRWHKPRHAAEVVDAFSDVVRTVGVLHARGVYHRDLKADNILIRRGDGRPFLIDFGTVRLPGALSQSLGIPEGVLHLLPPELMAYMRTEAWKRGEPFQGGVAADLYALGVLLYQALTDLHPFDPDLPDDQLVAAIAAVPPTPPHLLNPRAPRSLSDIAMKLLEKRPEERYPDTEALLQALWRAGKERTSSAWRVPLTTPESPSRVPLEEVEREQVVRHQQAAPTVEETREEASPKRRTWHVRHFAGMGLILLAVLLLASWLVRSTLAPSHVPDPTASVAPEKGSAPVPPHTTSQDSTPTHGGARIRLLAMWLCTTTSLGCPAAQVRPQRGDCPEQAQHHMFDVLKLKEGKRLQATIDIHQPGGPTEDGLYQDGPIIGRVVQYDWSPPELPGGTLLYGKLWTGPGLLDFEGDESVVGRYTEALLPDGRKLPVCIVLGAPDDYWDREPGSRPGTVQLPKELSAFAVRRWPPVWEK